MGPRLYPRYGVASVATTGVIEFHVLGDVVHCAPDPGPWWDAMGLPRPLPDLLDLRGVWGEDGRLYVMGFAITDWWNQYGAVQRAAYHRRRAHFIATGQRVLGGPVLGIGGAHGGAR